MKVLIINGTFSTFERNLDLVLSPDKQELLLRCLNKAGIPDEDISFCKISDRSEIDRSPATVLVPLGDPALKELTGLISSDKYHCSILTTRPEYGIRKVIPLLHPERILKNYGDIAYLQLGCNRINEQRPFSDVRIPKRDFLLGPSLEDTLKFIHECYYAPEIAVDIETSCGQINTMGIAISKTRAIAIRTTLDVWSEENYIKLWIALSGLLESSVPKVLQNAMYESLYLSRYGIRLNNVIHDTMTCMKFLYPELEKGLANVGRFYTPFPYWKDDSKEWNYVANWEEHLDYNCKDTTGTLWAYYEQVKDLKETKMHDLFYNFVQRFLDPAIEMCTRGLLVDETKLDFARKETQLKLSSHLELIDRVCETRLGHKINVRSPKQLKSALQKLGMKLPVAKGKESTDKKALVKLRKKYPDELILSSLLEVSASNKQLSSYINFDYDKESKRVNYTLDICGTETGRWASYTDPWGRGFNAQTVPKSIRKVFKAEPGKLLVQIDLSQAESRYVAYDSPEPTLMQLLQDKKDVHNFVASRIFNKLAEMINKQERQLGKKSGHAANYGVGPKTFSEACLVEMNLHITEAEAARIINAYYGVFPGIRRRQERIQNEIRATKRIVTPMGRQRFFYDRIGDSVFREAYAYAPQSTIPDITNSLMLFLWDNFEDVEFLLQVHDSLLLQVSQGREGEIAEAARDYQAWHPKISLAGGDLIIPVDVECGTYWEPMNKI